MFRRWLSEFISKNRDKIQRFFKMFLIVVVFLVIATLFLSQIDRKEYVSDKKKPVCNPQNTIVSGDDIDQEIYTNDLDVVNKFVQYCHNGQLQEAYDLLTEDCRKNLYPDINDFSEKYCKRYFSEKKEFNLQSWINEGNYRIYRMRIIDDILSTGNYDNSTNYQDYITVIGENNNKKLNINGYVFKKDINKIIEKDGIVIKVTKVDKYMTTEIYSLEVTNNTDKAILLDYMQEPVNTIQSVNENNTNNQLDVNSINYTKLTIESNQTKDVKLSFYKECSSSVNSKEIIFYKVVTDYRQFMRNNDNYNDFIEIEIDL